MTRLALSSVHDDFTVRFSALTGSIEASERNITSTIKDNIQEIRTLGVQRDESMEDLSTRLLQASRQRSLYKGVVCIFNFIVILTLLLNNEHLQVWDIIPGDIHVIKTVTRSLRCYRTGITYKDSYCTVENSNTLKIIREYQAHGNNGEDGMDLKVGEHYPVPSRKFT